MPCDSKPLTPSARDMQVRALERLNQALAAGEVSAVIGANGSIAFRGWTAEQRAGLADLCAYRRLMAANSPQLRRALARAEAIAGRKLDPRAVASGQHSHDGGGTWHGGH